MAVRRACEVGRDSLRCGLGRWALPREGVARSLGAPDLLDDEGPRVVKVPGLRRPGAGLPNVSHHLLADAEVGADCDGGDMAAGSARSGGAGPELEDLDGLALCDPDPAIV